MCDRAMGSGAVREACAVVIVVGLMLGAGCGGSRPGLEDYAGGDDGGMTDLRDAPGRGAGDAVASSDACTVPDCTSRGVASGEEASDAGVPLRDAGRPSAPAQEGKSASPPSVKNKPAKFVSIDDRLHAIHDDLRGRDNPSDRQRMRYIDLSHLSNAGASAAQLEGYRQAVSLLVNSLSNGQRIVPPEPIDTARLMLAIDLRDYTWDANTWEQIVRAYPYALAYDADSRVFPFDEDIALQNRQDTGTDIPSIEADWFIAHAALPPLYYDVLRLPQSIDQLARGLGIDIAREVTDEQVARAGFNSMESLNNRVIERHERPGFGGALWLSFDFRANEGERNVFAHPLDFRFDAGSGLFNLPNGLQAYFLMDERFGRIDRADPAIVSDPDSRDHITAAGLSCMGGCHLAQGVAPQDDLVRGQASVTAPSAAAREAVLALYPTVDAMRGLMSEDSKRYVSAVRQTGFDLKAGTTLSQLVRQQQDVLDLRAAAATLGLSEDQVRDALAAVTQFPPEVTVLRQRGGTVQRDAFDAVFAQFAQALGLGQPITPALARGTR